MRKRSPSSTASGGMAGIVVVVSRTVVATDGIERHGRGRGRRGWRRRNPIAIGAFVHELAVDRDGDRHGVVTTADEALRQDLVEGRPRRVERRRRRCRRGFGGRARRDRRRRRGSVVDVVVDLSLDVRRAFSVRSELSGRRALCDRRRRTRRWRFRTGRHRRRPLGATGGEDDDGRAGEPCRHRPPDRPDHRTMMAGRPPRSEAPRSGRRSSRSQAARLTPVTAARL